MAYGGTAGYLADFRSRGEAIADACTRCGACFRACPMVAPAGLAEARPEETARRPRGHPRPDGLHAEDLYKRLKMIRDIDDIIVETSPLIAEHGLDIDTVRDALLQEFGTH